MKKNNIPDNTHLVNEYTMVDKKLEMANRRLRHFKIEQLKELVQQDITNKLK